MSVNDRKRKGESGKKRQAKRAALGNERTNKAKRLMRQVRLFPLDKQAADFLATKIRAGTIPAFLASRAEAVLRTSINLRLGPVEI